MCAERVQVWQGKSGRRYVHTVYPTKTCPELNNAIYLAVGRDHSGTRRPLAIDGKHAFCSPATEHAAPLTPRQMTWADEVHVHLLARCDEAAAMVIDDLRAQYDLPHS